mmetsp:Transcript_94839/g.272004  ORF Transcript_94839/g.272004 Transcript_94839/m.272004 type:complete len:229 (+) Transcript_94839:242-928(+)
MVRMETHVLRAHVGGAPCAPHGAIAVPPVVDISWRAGQPDVRAKGNALVLLLQASYEPRVAVQHPLIPECLLLGVHLLLLREFHQLRSRMRLEENAWRSLLRRCHRLTTLSAFHEAIQSLPLARQDSLLRLREVHAAIGPHLHLPQDVLHLLLSVPLGHGYLVEHPYDGLDGTPRSWSETSVQGLSAVMRRHLSDLQIGVHVGPALASSQESILVSRPKNSIGLQTSR